VWDQTTELRIYTESKCLTVVSYFVCCQDLYLPISKLYKMVQGKQILIQLSLPIKQAKLMP